VIPINIVMQLVPRYLVKNKTVIITNDAGFVTEYKPVYSRQLNVYRGIDNTLEFKILNADQKPIDLTGKTINFVAFDENKNLSITRNGTNDSNIKGLVSVVINDSDTINLKDQYLSYNITIRDDTTTASTLTYSSSHFAQEGIIKLSSEAYPGPKISNTVTTFTQDGSVWNSNLITAEPGINGNEALHTVAFYTDEYVGRITIQATLDNDLSDPSQINWVDISFSIFNGTETEPKISNFNGVFNYLRFVTSQNPADTVTKILVRN
jgi:hypothetical protein